MIFTILSLLLSCLPAGGDHLRFQFICASSADPDSACALPGPKNIYAEDIGSLAIQFTWDPVPEAAYYRIKVFNAGTGVMAFSKLVVAVPEHNHAQLTGFQPAVNYTVLVNSVCSNGEESSRK